MPRKTLSARQLAALCDYAILKPELTLKDIAEGAAIAREYGAGCLFVRPTDVSFAARQLLGSSVRLASVVGFPYGYSPTRAKMTEAEVLLDAGCQELDMVINISRLKSGDIDFVTEDMGVVARLAHQQGRIAKVILETCYLNEDEKVAACRAAEAAGMDFVKTSTGLARGGATLADLRLMRGSCSPSVGVKAAGGIRTLDQVLSALAVGASRIGTSALKDIVTEARYREKTQDLIVAVTAELGGEY